MLCLHQGRPKSSTCAESVVTLKKLVQGLGLIVLACRSSPEALRSEALIHAEVTLQLLPCYLKLLLCGSNKCQKARLQKLLGQCVYRSPAASLLDHASQC